MSAPERRIPSRNCAGSDSDQPGSPERPRQAVLNACGTGAWEMVGGIPLVARFLHHLNGLGIEEVILLQESGLGSMDLERWRRRMRLRKVKIDGGKNIAAAILSTPRLAPRFLYLDGAHLMDPRLMAALSIAPVPTLAHIARDDEANGIVRAGILSIDDIETWAEEGIAALALRSAPLYPEDVDAFSLEIRGVRTPYFMEVRSRDDAQEATRLLIRSQQKFVMDLPAEYIDPFFEDPLTHWLCGTAITPNMVTLAGALVASLIVWLFWHGCFVAGALLMFAVEILDGVDGKLARTKLHFSWFGQHEDVIDYFCETMIYVALGVGLTARYGGWLPCIMTVLMIVSDTTDNVLSTLAGRWHGKSIDLFGPFDVAFRRIGGRRNIYGAIFIVGFVAGFPLQTFTLAALWAAVTAIVHGIRLLQFGRTSARLSRSVGKLA